MARRARLVVLVVVLLFVAIAAAVVASSEEAPASPSSKSELTPLQLGQRQWESDPRILDDTINHANVVELPKFQKEQIQLWNDAVAYNKRVAAAARAAAQASRGGGRGRSTPSGGSHRGYATWWECTSMVENHGDYGRSSNGSHFGRYQFSRGTWVAYGGSPATWGNASPEEQDRVFQNAVDRGGESNWRPYNGC